MISIILPNYCPDNEVTEHLKLFMESLIANTPKPFQLIVIENGSETQFLKDYADIYIHKDKPMGYARAVNLGLAAADGDFLIIMNNDLIVPQRWLETMIEDYEDGTLAPIDMPGSPQIFEDSHWFSLVMMDRKTFTKIGYLDEQINYRFHDQDYSIRVKKAGLHVRQTGRVVVKHVNSLTYHKMNRNEDPAERQIMIDRHGVAHFHEWIDMIR